MTTKTWNGSADPLSTAADWSPSGAPAEGDDAVIAGGSPSASGTLDGYEIDIAGATASGQPQLRLDGATLGTFEVLSLGESSGPTAFATVVAAGIVTNDGFISAPSAGGTLTISSQAAPVTPGLPPQRVVDFVNNGVISATGGTIRIENVGASLGNGFLNAGTVGVAGGGEVDLDAPVFGNGRIVLQGTATLNASESVSAGQTISFAGSAATPERLVLGMPGSVHAALRGLGAGDSIDVPGTVTGHVAGGTLTLSSGAALDIGAGYTDANFGFTADGHGGTLIGVVCYARGTRLLTAGGERPVEQLQPGDTVTTLSGEEAAVRWVGRRRVDVARHAAPDSVRPVRIAAHAFADGMPRRDLLVSPEHALFVDGVLVPARCLLNGRTVTQDSPAAVEYFHVELDRHHVLLAEGMPAESYLDTGNRTMFANAPVTALHPSAEPTHAAEACAPLVLGGAALEAVRARLEARAPALAA
ncbi:MAG: Hint domain-containing protein [Janthinobacterium lividum]